jgi:uncharacterized membrane protein
MTLSSSHKQLATIVALWLWCFLLVVVRIERVGESGILFLLWNLFLAFIPLPASALFKTFSVRRSWLGGGCFLFWLLFLPNSPYLLTDLIHLHSHPYVPLWYDLVIYLSYAGAGMAFGYLSLIQVQIAVEARYGRAAGWIVAVTSLLLCGFGIYIGRFLHWNSWEAVTNPLGLLADIGGRMLSPASLVLILGVSVIFGICLVLGYAALHVFANCVASALPEAAAHEPVATKYQAL